MQDQLETCEDDTDRKMALEAQDREFAKILHAKEKARARRAKEKARLRKLERQRLEEDKVEVLEAEDGILEAGGFKQSPRDKTSSSMDPELDTRFNFLLAVDANYFSFLQNLDFNISAICWKIGLLILMPYCWKK